MNESRIQALLRQGIVATKTGQPERARQALLQVVELDESNVQAWLWLSAVMDDPTDKFTCLHNVLTLDPDNKPAQAGLARLEQDVAGSAPQPGPEPAEPSVPPLKAADILPPSPASPSSPPLPSPSPPSSPPPPSPESSSEKPARTERSSSGQYKRLSPPSPSEQSLRKRPAHLEAHASTAAALLKDGFAARQPPGSETEASTQESWEESLAARERQANEPEPETTRPSIKVILLRVGIAIVSLLLCAPCSIIGSFGLISELALRYQGETIEAHVSDYRSSRDAGDFVVYEIQYQFSLDGKEWHSNSDLWASVSRADWDAAIATERLEVLYLPYNPGLNRPLNIGERSDPLGNSIKLVVLGIGVGVVFFVGATTLMSFMGHLTTPTPAEHTATGPYKRLSTQAGAEQSPTTHQQAASRPKHLQEHASLAAALIRGESTARGTSISEPELEMSDVVEPLPAKSGGAFCPFCRKPISSMATRCGSCNLPLVVDCPACEARLDVELETCAECGHSMGRYRHKTVYFANLAAAYQAQEKYRQAISMWQIVQRLNPNYPELQVRLAEAQAGAGRPNTAITTLRQVLEKDAGQEAASLVLGKIFHNLSYWDDAEAVYREALAVSPESAELHFALGWLLMEQNKLKQSFQYMHQATRLDPKHGMAWFRLGQIYQVTHRPKLAADAYRKAVVLLPENTLAHKKAARLAPALAPDLPADLAMGWAELIRQTTGPILICILAALLDSGMRPWWIPWTGWLALFLGIVGTFLWISGTSLPRNPAICYLAGERGLPSSTWRISMALVGGFFWLLAMSLILLPIGQSYPEVPAWILS